MNYFLYFFNVHFPIIVLQYPYSFVLSPLGHPTPSHEGGQMFYLRLLLISPVNWFCCEGCCMCKAQRALPFSALGFLHGRCSHATRWPIPFVFNKYLWKLCHWNLMFTLLLWFWRTEACFLKQCLESRDGGNEQFLLKNYLCCSLQRQCNKYKH